MASSTDSAKYLSCGILSGAIQALFFNPWDRAMYLSVKERRHFLSLENWKSPYQGFMQSVTHRILSHGCYFPFESFFVILSRRLLYVASGWGEPHQLSLGPLRLNIDSVALLSGGVMAGSLSAMLFHPFAVVKYYCWGKEEIKITQAFLQIWQGGRGALVFLRGGSSTLLRDLVFGGIFSLVRHQEGLVQCMDSMLLRTRARWSAGTLYPNGSHDDHCESLSRVSTQVKPSGTAYFMCNFVAAGLAVGAASPFNHIRNIKFSISPGQNVPSGPQILKELIQECATAFNASTKPFSDGKAPFRCVLGAVAASAHLHSRLKIGVGTLRVALGMAFGSQVYSFCTEVSNQ